MEFEVKDKKTGKYAKETREKLKAMLVEKDEIIEELNNDVEIYLVEHSLALGMKFFEGKVIAYEKVISLLTDYLINTKE